ncbi:MAG: VCBS repeat-containing protein [Thermoanaerobaculia bacterium]|nr:VCBS repeat-containing protein [Thermoanaerobaculia bacterium]
MRAREMRYFLFCLIPALLAPALGGQTAPDSLTPVCAPVAGGGSTSSAPPTLLVTLFDRWHEAWLGSPAVADLSGDGSREILAARDQKLLGWSAAGAIVFEETAPAGRIWSSPVVGELVPASPGLEVAAASRATLHLWSAAGNPIAPFPVTWRDELRSLAAGEIDGDAALELVVATTSRLEAGGQRDLLMAYELNGAVVTGFPPNTSGASGCVADCNITGGFDQNLALGDLDGDGVGDIAAPHDNAYLSIHDQDGWMHDAAAVYPADDKVAGIRFLHDLALAQQGWPSNPPVDNQAHFTNSAPAIADLDGDGANELVVLGSVQNAAQTDRLRGVGLWLLGEDGARRPGWETPLHLSTYLGGLWDLGGNIVGITNQVSIADLDPPSSGLEIVFAGFDGRIYAVRRDRSIAWSYAYTNDAAVFTGGVALADLSGDGRPEVIFNSYSSDIGKGKLFVLGPDGALQHQIPLPDRGAMPVPTVADVDGGGAGTLEIVVSLKDGVDHVRQLLVFTVPGSAENCLPWPTGRGNYLRNGSSAFLPAEALFADGFESGNTAAWGALVPEPRLPVPGAG